MLAYFSSIGSLATFNVAFTEFINSKLNIEKNWIKQLVSWLLPVLISVIGLVFGLGMFADFGTISSVTAWVYTILTGFGTGLISNGIYDINTVKLIIDSIKSFKVNK